MFCLWIKDICKIDFSFIFTMGINLDSDKQVIVSTLV
jgi:hypothetical protein